VNAAWQRKQRRRRQIWLDRFCGRLLNTSVSEAQ
jgi:hypothetical protein